MDFNLKNNIKEKLNKITSKNIYENIKSKILIIMIIKNIQKYIPQLK